MVKKIEVEADESHLVVNRPKRDEIVFVIATMATLYQVVMPRRACFLDPHGPKAELSQRNRTVELGKACLTRDWPPNDLCVYRKNSSLGHDRFLGFGNVQCTMVVTRAGYAVKRLNAVDRRDCQAARQPGRTGIIEESMTLMTGCDSRSS